MIACLIIWTYVFILALLCGHAFFHYLNKYLFGGRDAEYPRAVLLALTGLVILATLTSYVSLFVKIGYMVNLAFFVLAMVYLLGNRKEVTESLLAEYDIVKGSGIVPLLFIALWSASILIISSQRPVSGSEGVYYEQTVKWIAQYGTVKGLGNLSGRLAFSSSWHQVAALFHGAFPFIPGFYDLNGLLFILAYIYAMTGIGNRLSGYFRFLMVLMPVFIDEYPIYVNSVGPDMVNAVFYWTVFVLFLEKIEEKSMKIFDAKTVMLVLFSAFAVTVKYNTIFLLLASAYVVAVNAGTRHNVKSIIAAAAVVVAVTFPWLIRNIMLSGYLVYPVYQIDLFNFDWKVPLEFAKTDFLYNLNGRIWLKPYFEIAGMSFREWVPVWFARNCITSPGFMRIVVSLPLVTLFYMFFLGFLAAKKLDLRTVSYYVMFYLGLAGVILWLPVPAKRYGLGAVLTYFCGAPALLMYLICRNNPGSRRIMLAALLCAAQVGITVRMADMLPKVGKNDIMIYRNYEKPGLKKIRYNGIAVNIPLGTRECRDAELPCAAERTYLGGYDGPPLCLLHLRGDGIKSGFRLSDDGR
ncbi:MAG: hypothetical protein JXJ19_08360 [Elusimicrobia bacterium]|nr:hypothetical protein [Elusimicrobiota bacterium]